MTLFLDIETKNNWESGDSFKVDKLEISYVGVIDQDEREYDFWEEDMEKLGQLLNEAELIVHFNGFTFDMPVIANYLGDEVLDLAQVDLMHAMYKTIGFRPKLDDLARATLGVGKIGKGSDAVVYWETGQLDKLREYCIRDVKVTKDIYDYGINNGKVKYFDRNGFLKETEINWSEWSKDAAEQESEDVLSMF